MKTRVSVSVFAGVLALALSAPFASAKLFNFSHSDHKSATVDFLYAAKLGNGPEIQPGNYKMTLMDDSNTPKVGFYQNGKLVAETSAKLVSEPEKSQQTEIFYNHQGKKDETVTQVQISGWTQKLVFSNSNASKPARSGA